MHHEVIQRGGQQNVAVRPGEEQLTQSEQELMGEALKPFHAPKLRGLILNIQKSLEQVIDEVSQDELLGAGFDAQALAGFRSGRAGQSERPRRQ